MSGYIRVGPEPRPCDTFKTCTLNPDGFHVCTTRTGTFQYRRPDRSIYIRENGLAKNYNNGEDEFDIGPRRSVDLTKLDRDRVEKYFDLYESCPELDQASTPVASRYSNSVEMMTPIGTPTASPMTPLSQLDSGSHPSLPSTSISDMIANLSIETIQNNRFGSYTQHQYYPVPQPAPTRFSPLNRSGNNLHPFINQARNTSTPFDPTYMEASTGTQVHMHSPQTMPSLASITESASTNRINPNITVENEALSRSVEEACAHHAYYLRRYGTSWLIASLKIFERAINNNSSMDLDFNTSQRSQSRRYYRNRREHSSSSESQTQRSPHGIRIGR